MTEIENILDYYHIKSDLVELCRKYNLPISGNKEEIKERIITFQTTGKVIKPKCRKNTKIKISSIDDNMLIGNNFVCSELHRAFFVARLGKNFSFNVDFQKWLKLNGDKKYSDAIVAYQQIMDKKKRTKSIIGKQYEYNTYIRDFFLANIGKSLADAIKCWKYKKSLRGHNRYENSDLIALK